ncbi:hypothetical protein CAEBREN_18637 [Caenorhabditis brenneri]|uniref:PAN-3 domain-containing protein n=1 Tax=Caenorhabditis brenneri TaxID=135651 RepID=G0NCJ4_CAEBE|nr:hypothetical protein CAEBREN_18637 [Caenorhabditis brenneri]
MLVYFLLFFFVSTGSTAKIVLVWGKVEQSGVPEVYTDGWDSCVKKCLNEVDCVAIIPTNSECQLFRLGTNLTVTKTEERTGIKVGFKESFALDDVTYINRINENKTYSSVQWSFQFQGKIQCQDDSLPMERGNITVCVSVRPFTGTMCQNQTAGETLCKNNRGMGITGPYTYEEGNILAGAISHKFPIAPVNVVQFAELSL